MKINILKTVAAAGLAAFSLTSFAQNLDPTVVVDRTYEGKLLEVHKPALEMAVPDSVKQFDLDFDYDVFENPYKGSYEFRPYQLLLKPVSSGVDMPSFWLKAGAGYTLHPELGLVWTPVRKGPFKMNVYADFNSYFGAYHELQRNVDEGLSVGRWEKTDGKWDGFRLKSSAGLDGRYDWEKSAFSFDLGYFGVASKDNWKTRSYNSFDMNMRMASKPRQSRHFMYDLSLDYRLGMDDLEYRRSMDRLTEHVMSFDAVLGPSLSADDRLRFEAGLDVAAYAGALEASAGQVEFAPHYVLSNGKWNIDLGIKLSKLLNITESEQFKAKEQFVYPDIRIRYAAAPEALVIYLNAVGGSVIKSYSDLLDRNPFMDPYSGTVSPVLDAEVTRVNARLGFEGRISKRFSYDIYGGFASYASGLLDAVSWQAGAGYVPGFAYSPYQKLYAGLGMNLNADSVNFDADVEYAHVTGLTAAEDAMVLFMPAALTGDVRFEYNWNRRVFAGVDCRFSTKRRGNEAGIVDVLPGFADLGVFAEYALNRRISFWLRGGNLLDMNVQYCPLYAERGVNFTAGIRLKL